MTPEEQAACLAFTREFHQSPVFWEGEEKHWSLIFHEGHWHERPEHAGVTSGCLSRLREIDAYGRWIVWLMEEAARLHEGSMLKIELSKAPPCFVQMWQAHGVGGSPLLALLDAVSRAKRQEAEK